MPEGVSKKSKYEIIATLREELRVHSKLYFYFNGIKHQVTLKKVDSSCFYIILPPPHIVLPTEETFFFTIHSMLGKIEFITNKRIAVKNNLAGLICFVIPDNITILQRRLTPRINAMEGYHFFCSGRHKNGTSFKFCLNDISDGGCSFISPWPLFNFIKKDSKLENVELNLGEYGQVTVNLKIKNIQEQENQKISNKVSIKISCMFYFRNEESRRNIQDIVIKLMVNNKIKNSRIF